MSLKLKTILGVAFIEAILLAVLISMTLNYLETTNYEGLYKRATTTATLFSTTTKDAVISYDLASLDAFSSELMKNPDLVYVKVLNPDGQIFAQAGKQKYLERDFIEDIDVSMINDGVFDVRAEISEGGQFFGEIRIGIDTSGLTQAITEARYWSATIAFGEMLLVALFSYILGSYLTNRLSKLREAANDISHDNMDIKLDAKGSDEVAEVAQAFIQMSSRLRQESERRTAYEKELKSLNSTLEMRVERRTAQLRDNIVKLEEMNEALKQTHAQLIQSEKMASIGTLAAGVAHEINNPVGYVMSNVRMLSEYIEFYREAISKIRALDIHASESELIASIESMGSWFDEQDIEFIQSDTLDLVKDTVDGTERIRDIVSGLKEFSHSSPDTVMQFANLNEAIERTLKIAHNELKYKSKVVTKLKDIPVVECNVGQIQQVLLNLVINANHSIEENGLIQIQSGVLGSEVFVSVRDNGCGIPAEMKKKIFDPFFTTKEVGKGTGLGLSIVYGIMKDHKGRIDLESTPGKGTKFTLYFPVQSQL
ncbi:HAMP domain-containing protein [Marinomonas mediterranea]|uniref:sensor histidine kinase n=1 Tax=Marinomonas mediterranea TaxID=119864 RepID=UPI00234950D8|nr:ATP-binding protein [Marinomonas mediterranea]WCN12747.1 HAMP domain-containing protein [Marinomonas mediterranea]